MVDESLDVPPGAHSIELLYIPASELVADVRQLDLVLHDTGAFRKRRTRYVFTIQDPKSLKRDFKKSDLEYALKRTTHFEPLTVQARTFVSQRQ